MTAIPPPTFAGDLPQILVQVAGGDSVFKRVVSSQPLGSDAPIGDIFWISQNLSRGRDKSALYTIKSIWVEVTGAVTVRVDASVDGGVTYSTSVISEIVSGDAISIVSGYAGITGQDPRIRIFLSSIDVDDVFRIMSWEVELTERPLV